MRTYCYQPSFSIEVNDDWVQAPAPQSLGTRTGAGVCLAASQSSGGFLIVQDGQQQQPPFPNSNQWERERIKKGLSLHVGNTCGQLHASQWPKAGHLATLGHDEWWKTFLFQTALSPVTTRVSVLMKKGEKRAGQRQEGKCNLFHRDTYVYPVCDSTHFINWTTLGQQEVVASGADGGHCVSGRTKHQASVLRVWILCWDPLELYKYS